MKYIKYLLTLVICCVFVPVYAAHISLPFLKSSVEIVDSAEAAPLLGKDDGYPERFSKFDIDSRLGNGAKYSDYFKMAMKHTLNWTAAEQEEIRAAFAAIATYCTEQGITLNLPDKIYLIKSDTKNEFGAEGYTRGNCIVLNTAVEGVSTGVAAHELFHVFSRYNEKKRDELYHVFGFKKCNPIVLNPAMHNRNITNPDCPVVSHYITIDGKDMTLVLYANKDYTGGSVFTEYGQVGLLTLQGDDAHKTADESTPVKEVQDMPAIFEQVGTNTGYLLHPEEICAEHFAMMITGRSVKQPEKIAEFKTALKI